MKQYLFLLVVLISISLFPFKSKSVYDASTDAPTTEKRTYNDCPTPDPTKCYYNSYNKEYISKCLQSCTYYDCMDPQANPKLKITQIPFDAYYALPACKQRTGTIIKINTLPFTDSVDTHPAAQKLIKPGSYDTLPQEFEVNSWMCTGITLDKNQYGTWTYNYSPTPTKDCSTCTYTYPFLSKTCDNTKDTTNCCPNEPVPVKKERIGSGVCTISSCYYSYTTWSLNCTTTDRCGY